MYERKQDLFAKSMVSITLGGLNLRLNLEE